MATSHNLRATGERIEQLLDELQSAADPRLYRLAQELLRLVTELYGAGLARIVELLDADDPAARRRLLGDDLVASLLLVHDLHPDPAAKRVEDALAEVRPLLAAHGGDVELLDSDVAQGTVRLRLLGSCDGCPSSAVTLRLAVERAILDAVPEIASIEVDQPSQDAPATPIALVPKPSYDECPAELTGA